MIDFLLGVPGKLKTISDYLTGTLYPYITTRTANLDTTISSRAAASTALTNATWTDTRAAKIDTIDTTVSATARIKLIQRGTIALSNGGFTTGTSTITAVVTAKTELRCLGFSATSGDITSYPRLELTNTTTVTATRGGTSGAVTVSWEVTEYY